MSVHPIAAADVNMIAIDVWFEWQRIWLHAYAEDARRFWLAPYFASRSTKKPKGYYFKLARLQRS